MAAAMLSCMHVTIMYNLLCLCALWANRAWSETQEPPDRPSLIL